MGYIKFRLVRQTDASGNTLHVRVSGMESDLPSLSTLQPNMVYHALAKRKDVQMLMKVDVGILDRDLLADSEALRLDEGHLNVDKLY